MKYTFEWDPFKAITNKNKHKINFEIAATVFKDPKAFTIFDAEHSDEEERWLTLGFSEHKSLIVVNHTFFQNNNSITIRIISSRKATKKEQSQYLEG